jgi:hypothetical protein
MGLLSAHNDNPETTTYYQKENASLVRCVDWVQWRLRVKIVAVGKVEGLMCPQNRKKRRFTTFSKPKEKQPVQRDRGDASNEATNSNPRRTDQ